MKQSLGNFLCNTGQASYETPVTISVLNYHTAYLKGMPYTDFLFLKTTIPTNYVSNLKTKNVKVFHSKNIN